MRTRRMSRLWPRVRSLRVMLVFAATAFGMVVCFGSPSASVAATGPVTTVSLVPAQPDGLQGWYRQAVQVALSAPDSPAGTASTEYRVDLGAWLPYSTPFTI